MSRYVSAMLCCGLLVGAVLQPVGVRANLIDDFANGSFCLVACNPLLCGCKEVSEMCKQCAHFGKKTSGCNNAKNPNWCFPTVTTVASVAGGAALGAGLGAAGGGAAIGAITASATVGLGFAPGAVVGAVAGGISGGASGALTGGLAAQHIVDGLIKFADGFCKLGKHNPPKNMVDSFCLMVEKGKTAKLAEAARKEAESKKALEEEKSKK